MNKFYLKKKIIVTGGAGFIGSHLVEELVNQQAEVTVLDDLSAGTLANLAHITSHNLKFVQGSINDISLLRKLFLGKDLVFHQAAISSVSASIENPILSHEVNLTGSLNILQVSFELGIKKVICASSSAVYGNGPALPKRENMTPEPQSPYAITKLAMEHYCAIFQSVYGLNTVCLRYFNVYGSRQNPYSQYSAVIPKFIQMVKEGRPPVIFGDGEQTRDFIFVKDVVNANLLIAEQDATGIYNIGTGESISLNTLANLIVNLADHNIKPIYEKPRPGDVKHSVADISKALTFGFKPKYNLRLVMEKPNYYFK